MTAPLAPARVRPAAADQALADGRVPAALAAPAAAASADRAAAALAARPARRAAASEGRAPAAAAPVAAAADKTMDSGERFGGSPLFHAQMRLRDAARGRQGFSSSHGSRMDLREPHRRMGERAGQNARFLTQKYRFFRHATFFFGKLISIHAEVWYNEANAEGGDCLLRTSNAHA